EVRFLAMTVSAHAVDFRHDRAAVVIIPQAFQPTLQVKLQVAWLVVVRAGQRWDFFRFHRVDKLGRHEENQFRFTGAGRVEAEELAEARNIAKERYTNGRTAQVGLQESADCQSLPFAHFDGGSDGSRAQSRHLRAGVVARADARADGGIARAHGRV